MASRKLIINVQYDLNNYINNIFTLQIGLRAKEIHLCGEASAVPLIKAICATIDEEVEVRKYERLSPLIISEHSLKGNIKKIEKGDCVVTFSRKNIFAVKQEIEKETGYNCAVAYGGLPPG